MKKLFYLISLIFLSAVFTTQAYAISEYNTNDKEKLQSFMKAGGTGTENWRKYFNSEPTWTDDYWVNVKNKVVWNDESPKRIIRLYWGYENLSGTLDVSGCTALTTLSCHSNELNSLNVSGCTALTTLSCGINQLPSLDVSDCTALTTLDCDNNLFTSLDVSDCKALMSLVCSENQYLTSLDVSGCTALTTLSCNRNQLLASLDVSGCTELTTLNCNGNKLLTSLDASGCTELTSLNCYLNQLLTSLDVSGCTALTSLDCYKSQLPSLDVSDCTALTSLKCYENQLTSLVVSGCTELTFLQCYENQLPSLDVSDCTALTTLSCKENLLTSLDVSDCKALRYLYCKKNQLASLDVSGCIELTQFECEKNQLASLDLSGCTKLTYLSCEKNQLTSLKISDCKALVSLSCYENQLTSLKISDCKALGTLYCYKNQLTSLEISGCTDLMHLYCYENQLTSLDLLDYMELRDLRCYENQLTSLDLSGAKYLNALNCSSNHLTSLDLSGAKYLNELNCSSNHFTLSELPDDGSLAIYDYAPQSLTGTAYPGQKLMLSNLEQTQEKITKYRIGDTGGFTDCPDGVFPVPLSLVVGSEMTLYVTCSDHTDFDETNPLKYTLTIVAVPPSTPYTVDLSLGEGILANHPAGKLDVIEGEDFYLTFYSEIEGVTADHFIFLVDGVETAFNNLGEAYHYTYNLSDIDCNHTISVSLRTNTVTIPVIEGVTTTPGAGTHQVPYGQPFTFTLTLADDYDQSDVRILVNGNDVTPTLRATVYTVTLDRLTEPVSITILGVKKNSTVGNADIAGGEVELTVDNGQLTIDSADGKAMDVSIYNLRGQVVAKRKVVGNGTFTLSAGIYLVRVDGETHKVVVSD